MTAIVGKTLVDLGWQVVVDHLARRCRTSGGESMARELGPALDRDTALSRIATISEIRRLADDDVGLPFAGITDVEAPLARASKGGVLADEELVAVAATARGLARLRRVIEAHAALAPNLQALAADLCDAAAVYREIDAAYRDDGRLADHASESLGRLRREAARLGDRLRGRMDAMVGELESHLQDRYFTQRGDRFVVPVRVGARGRVPGIVHGTSQSGQTVFVEPAEIVDIGNQLKLAECAVADEEERIRGVLSRVVEAAADELRAGSDAAIYLDLLAAGAALAADCGGVAPIIDDGVALDLKAARHPHLVLAGRPCVANDIRLDARSILIVSGPNAGGKTVALKTAGLAVLMARAGLHVLAAPGSRLTFFDSVLTDIGDAQSLEQDLSTFTGHLVNLRSFLGGGGPGVLLLIDEIAVGTEPEQGAALAQAVLEGLAERGTCAIVTTHYERLKALAAEHGAFANASVGFDMSAMRPTFELHLGVPGSSGALIVARELGLDARVIARAEALLGTEKARIEELLMEVSAERERLASEHERLAAAVADAEREKARAAIAREEALAAKRRAHESAHDEAVAALRQARSELERAREASRRRSGDLREVEKQIDRAAREVRERGPRRAPDGAIPELDALVPGTRVEVLSLGSRGQVLAAPERGQVQVQVGAMKTSVPVEQLRLVGGGPSPRPSASHRSGLERAGDAGTGRGADTTLDLRGARVDEALELVDRFIDSSLLAERELVFLVHGHGSGALRKAIRRHLDGHKCVASHRPGERAEGGDGVTVVALS